MIRVLRRAAYVLVALGAAAVGLNILGIYLEHGFSGVQMLLSPHNFLQYALHVSLLLPGVALYAFADYLEKRRRARNPER